MPTMVVIVYIVEEGKYFGFRELLWAIIYGAFNMQFAVLASEVSVTIMRVNSTTM